MARVKFLGTKKARISWSSMGRGFSYNVRPGQTIAIPDDQVNNIKGAGHFTVVSAPMREGEEPKVRVKTISREPEVTPIRTPKLDPIVVKAEVVKPAFKEAVVEEEVVVEEVGTEDETKILNMIDVLSKEEEDVEEDPVIDYTSIRKNFLKDMCRERGLPVRGNRDDLIAKLVAFDKGVILDQ